MSTAYDGFLTDIYDFCPYFRYRGNTADFYLRKLNTKNKAVLELGTATGSITVPLAETGYIVDTVDSSSDMQRKAKSKMLFCDKSVLNRVNFILSDVLEFVPERKYGSVIIPDSLLTVLPGETDQVKLLKMCYDALADGGRIILDVFNPNDNNIMKAAYTERSRFYDGNRDAYIVTARHDINKYDRLHHCTYDYEKWSDAATGKDTVSFRITYRYLYPSQIKAMLQEIGFGVTEIAEIFDGNISLFVADKK